MLDFVIKYLIFFTLGEKPFKCPVCGDAFRTTGHLSTHVIIHERKKKRK